jgi:hypothetical protein
MATLSAQYVTADLLCGIIDSPTITYRYVSALVSWLTSLRRVLVCLVLRFRNDRLNKKNREKLASMSEDEKERLRQQLAYADKTDRENPFFVYTH